MDRQIASLPAFPVMSIKHLAALVFLLVAGVFASVRSYLAVDRAPLPQPAAGSNECCDAAQEEASGGCDGTAAIPSPREGHRVIYRSMLALRRHEAAAQIPADS